ncbi:MAG: RCC1 domain-containing protein, partial [Actinomycetes bacterium]
MSDAGKEPRRELARRSVGVDRVGGLVERGLDLAAALSQGAFVSVATGSHHTLALQRDGSLWAWGSNDCGQLGLGDTDKRDRPTR